MPRLGILPAVLLVLLTTLGLAPTPSMASDLRAYHRSLEARYAHAHSLGDNYQFDPRDGWQTVNASNLLYKYSRNDDYDNDYGDDDDGTDDHEEDDEHEHFTSLEKRASNKTSSTAKSKSKAKATSKSKSKTASKSKSKSTSKSTSKSSSSKSTNSVTSSLQKIVDSIKGIGKSEPVTITWYTGKDLLNPSCWSNPTWAPTDASFVSALTLDGWTTKPQCFKFLELCNTPKKCVFVRVVDSCAGCAKGSKHVDLTQAAFKELADLGTGILQVQMRQATDPDGWLENLWGPQS
ncbi:hypothetical protein NM688_g7051 [Phlebia brevispora]|uniref:Uncharacterized protein n=1 Tax=Phlebia brevispora TaxID=194682 RepID=A0ACC1S9H4_9APHY|nr:hypothetical protein NM688_g7051 [Phlebia brevispora]